VQLQHLLIALVQAGPALRQRVLGLHQLTLQVPALEPELVVKAGLFLRQRVLGLQQLTLQVLAVDPELLVAG